MLHAISFLAMKYVVSSSSGAFLRCQRTRIKLTKPSIFSHHFNCKVNSGLRSILQHLLSSCWNFLLRQQCTMLAEKKDTFFDTSCVTCCNHGHWHEKLDVIDHLFLTMFYSFLFFLSLPSPFLHLCSLCFVWNLWTASFCVDVLSVLPLSPHFFSSLSVTHVFWDRVAIFQLLLTWNFLRLKRYYFWN